MIVHGAVESGVLAFGNAMMDAVAFVNGDFTPYVGLHTGSVTHLSRSKLEDILLLAHEPNFISGGAAANAVKIAACLGLPCSFSGAIGSDDLGNLFRGDLSASNVSCELAIKEGHTGLVLSMINPDGITTIAADRGAAAEFIPSDIPLELFKRHQTILLEGYLLYNKPLFDFILDEGTREGARLVLDVSSWRLAGSFREFLLERVIPRLSLLFMNEDEQRSLSGSGFEHSIDFLSGLPCTSVVKFGAKGAAAVYDGAVVRVPAPIAVVHDSTGCGDSFLGGYLFAESRGCGMEGCLLAGSAAAGHVLGVAGTGIDTERLRKVVRAALETVSS